MCIQNIAEKKNFDSIMCVELFHFLLYIFSFFCVSCRFVKCYKLKRNHFKFLIPEQEEKKREANHCSSNSTWDETNTWPTVLLMPHLPVSFLRKESNNANKQTRGKKLIVTIVVSIPFITVFIHIDSPYIFMLHIHTHYTYVSCVFFAGWPCLSVIIISLCHITLHCVSVRFKKDIDLH